MRTVPFKVVVVGLLWSLLPLAAQESDGPPVDVQQILTMLQQLRDAKEQKLKSVRNDALQKAISAAASPQAAAMAWEEAVRAVQFEGVAREGAHFREWKENEGAGLREKEGANAARLYFQWLTLTLQRANGATAQQLLPSVIQYARDLAADQAAMIAFEERLADAKESAKEVQANKRASSIVERSKDDEKAKHMHAAILNRGLANSPPVQAYKVGDLLNAPNWEENPGNLDGIYAKIILPELRRTADARVLEYWDMKLRRESEAVSLQKLAFETEKFNQVRRPELLWSRAKDEFLIGKRNRAVANMFSLIKGYPTHPSQEQWIGELERCLKELVAPSGK